MKYLLYLVMIFVFLRCMSSYKLNDVNSIFEKLVVFEEREGFIYSEGNIILIDGERYVIEEKVIYDNEGRCLFFYIQDLKD